MPDSPVVFGDSSLVFGDLALSNAILTRTEICAEHTRRDRAWAVGGAHDCLLVSEPMYRVNMEFIGITCTTNPVPRKEFLRRRCEDMSVNELLGVVNWKLRQRKQGGLHVG